MPYLHSLCVGVVHRAFHRFKKGVLGLLAEGGTGSNRLAQESLLAWLLCVQEIDVLAEVAQHVVVAVHVAASARTKEEQHHDAKNNLGHACLVC